MTIYLFNITDPIIIAMQSYTERCISAMEAIGPEGLWLLNLCHHISWTEKKRRETGTTSRLDFSAIGIIRDLDGQWEKLFLCFKHMTFDNIILAAIFYLDKYRTGEDFPYIDKKELKNEDHFANQTSLDTFITHLNNFGHRWVDFRVLPSSEYKIAEDATEKQHLFWDRRLQPPGHIVLAFRLQAEKLGYTWYKQKYHIKLRQ